MSLEMFCHRSFAGGGWVGRTWRTELWASPVYAEIPSVLRLFCRLYLPIRPFFRHFPIRRLGIGLRFGG